MYIGKKQQMANNIFNLQADSWTLCTICTNLLVFVQAFLYVSAYLSYFT